MKVILFGATRMIGQGVLRECLLASDVELVETVGREPSGVQHPKVREVVHREMWDYSAIEPALTGFDACFFCLGVSFAGMSEADYHSGCSGNAGTAECRDDNAGRLSRRTRCFEIAKLGGIVVHENV